MHLLLTAVILITKPNPIILNLMQKQTKQQFHVCPLFSLSDSVSYVPAILNLNRTYKISLRMSASLKWMQGNKKFKNWHLL